MSLGPFVVDCDTGRDDALTLWISVLAELDLAAVVASYGNTSLSNVIDNTARVLAMVNADNIPLLAGAEGPTKNHRLFSSVVLERQKTIGNGLCNIQFPVSSRPLPSASTPEQTAHQLETIARRKGPLDYFIIGPASNFAAVAHILGTSLNKTIAQVTMMGGKLDDMWDNMPGADFNIACDPFAVDQVMHSGIPMRFVPLNATWPIFMTLEGIQGLAPLTPLAAEARNLMIAYCQNFAPEPIFRFHDPSVIVAAQMDKHFAPRKIAVVCDENSENFGRLVESNSGTVCQIYETDENTRAEIKQTILHWLGFSRS